jgi:arylsulfatase A-like enzyme
MQRDGR